LLPYRIFFRIDTLFIKKYLTVVLLAELPLWLNTCFIAHTASQSLVWPVSNIILIIFKQIVPIFLLVFHWHIDCYSNNDNRILEFSFSL